MSKDKQLGELEQEASEQRERLVQNVSDLKVRLQPANLLHEGVEQVTRTAKDKAQKVADVTTDLTQNIWDGGRRAAEEHAVLIATGAVLTAGAVFAIRQLTKKKPVPIYDAYGMEEQLGMVDGELGSRWSKIKDETANIGAKAEDAYGFARAAAHDAADAVRERTGETVGKVRSGLESAGRRIQKTSEDSPSTTIMAGLALGVLAGLLVPKSGSKTGSDQKLPKKAKALSESLTDIDFPEKDVQTDLGLDHLKDVAEKTLSVANDLLNDFIGKVESEWKKRRP